jgi:hypothetical protein
VPGESPISFCLVIWRLRNFARFFTRDDWLPGHPRIISGTTMKQPKKDYRNNPMHRWKFFMFFRFNCKSIGKNRFTSLFQLPKYAAPARIPTIKPYYLDYPFSMVGIRLTTVSRHQDSWGFYD